jgi:hypothetical protein
MKHDPFDADAFMDSLLSVSSVPLQVIMVCAALIDKQHARALGSNSRFSTWLAANTDTVIESYRRSWL